LQGADENFSTAGATACFTYGPSRGQAADAEVGDLEVEFPLAGLPHEARGLALLRRADEIWADRANAFRITPRG